MKSLFSFMLLSFVFASCQKTEELPSTPADMEEVNVQAPVEEDCDDKAKKPIEINEEGLSLGGGDAGCTLE